MIDNNSKIILSLDARLEFKKRQNGILHKEYVEKIDDITKSYASMKKLVRQNYVQKNIVSNQNIYESLLKLKQSTESLMFVYQRDKA